METRPLGKTDIELTKLSFGASSLGAEFRGVDIGEALASVHAAIDCGMNFIDTSPFYGRGMSEILLGRVLPEIPRDKYYLGTKLGRYAGTHFDFSARRVEESVDFSARLLTNAPLPEWHKATPAVREVAKKTADYCTSRGVDIAALALQFSVSNPDVFTCVTGSANPQRVAQWADWADQPLDEQLLAEVQEILKPIQNWFYVEGRPENND